jgi:hypothetical protein
MSDHDILARSMKSPSPCEVVASAAFGVAEN